MVGKRLQNNRIFYQVKWVGYPSFQNTWEPQENLLQAKDLIETYEKSIEKPIVLKSAPPPKLSKRIKKPEIPKRAHFLHQEEEELEEEEKTEEQEIKKKYSPRSIKRPEHIKNQAKKPTKVEKRMKSLRKNEQKIEQVTKSYRLARSTKPEKGSFEKNDVPERILGCISGANVERNKREFLVRWYERKEGGKVLDSIQTAENIKQNCADLLLNFYEEGYYLG